MLRTSASRGEDKMNALALVRADECEPVASDDFMDRFWRTAKDELALVVGCAASAGYTQQGDEPEQPCENLPFHFALHLTPPSVYHACKNKLAVSPLEWFGEIARHGHCPFLADRAFFAPALPSLVVWPMGWVSSISIPLPAWRTGT